MDSSIQVNGINITIVAREVYKDNEKYIFSVTEGEKYNSSSTYLVEGQGI